MGHNSRKGIIAMAITTSAQDLLRNAKVDLRQEVPSKYWDLIDKYRKELTDQAAAILGSVEDAEDVVQETFVEAFRDNERFAQVRSIGAWLRTINRCNALNRLRDRKRDSNRFKQQESDGSLTTGGLGRVDMCESVTVAIESLPLELRKVVVLRYWEHLSYKEISKRLRLPSGTVGRMLYEASMLLFERLKIQFDAADAAPAPEIRPPEEVSGDSEGESA